jgi:hypothetical protein
MSLTIGAREAVLRREGLREVDERLVVALVIARTGGGDTDGECAVTVGIERGDEFVNLGFGLRSRFLRWLLGRLLRRLLGRLLQQAPRQAPPPQVPPRARSRRRRRRRPRRGPRRRREPPSWWTVFSSLSFPPLLL